MLPEKEDIQIEAVSRKALLPARWKSDLFSFQPSKKGARRWHRKANSPARQNHEDEAEPHLEEDQLISNLSKWKKERLQARLTITLGSFMKRELHPSEAFVESHCERLAQRPDFAGRGPAVRAALHAIDDAIEAAFARCLQPAAGVWTTAADAADAAAGRPSTARIRRDEVRQLILQGDRLLSGEGRYALAVESRSASAPPVPLPAPP